MKAPQKITALLLVLFTLGTLLCGCAKKPSETDLVPAPAPSVGGGNTTSSDTPQANTETAPTYRHPITGLGCELADTQTRPVAFMIDNELNYKNGDYQNLGLAEADLIFETNIESNGSGTRMMAVFSQSTLKQTGFEVGGLRSARPYFMQLAKMLDAYYVHEGSSSKDDVLPSSITDQSYYARQMLYSGYVDSLEAGVNPPASYRPDSDTYQKLCVVSSAIVANTSLVLQELIERAPRSTYDENRETDVFRFGDTTLTDGTDAASVRIQFSLGNSFYTQSKFTYDADSKTYVRSQYLYPRVYNENDDLISKDIKTGKTLNFTNVFVLSTNQYPCDRDYGGNYYHTKVDLIGHEGSGFYFTAGKCIPITWKCESDDAPIRYYTEDGAELVVNPGKTFVNLVDSEAMGNLEIK